MPAGGGRLALSVSKAMMAASHLAVGDQADVDISGVGAARTTIAASHWEPLTIHTTRAMPRINRTIPVSANVRAE